MGRDLLESLAVQKDAMVELLGRLVTAESPSNDKGAVDALATLLAKELETCGAKVEILPVTDYGNHVRAELPGDGEPVLLLGHMDTVWELGTIQDMPFRVENGRAYGPGVFDMKAGLVQLIFALKALSERGGGPARVLLTSDEEIGSHSSRRIIEELARSSRAVLVLEPSLPPDGKLKTFRKGVGIFHLAIEGRAAHAGLDPGKGVNALEELARQIQALHRLNDPEKGVTVTVGVARGGTRVNVVPREAHAEIDLRVSTLKDARRMEELLLGLAPSLPGARVRVTGGIDRPPLERSPQVVGLYERARALAREIGFELGEGPAGGGSDGNLTAALGVPTLDGLGAVGDGAHAASEHAVVEELPRRAALLVRLVEVLTVPSY